MTLSSRERGRRGRRAYEEEFVLYLQGIPAHCRWQELKDFVRQTALHIRQAVVYDDEHGYPTGMGQIIVKNEDEAWRTFQKLSSSGWEGQPLTVTLARASCPTSPIAGPTRSSMPSAAYGKKFARHELPTALAPDPLQAPSTSAAGTTTTSYPSLIPMQYYTPISHGHASHHSFPTAVDSGFQSPAWNPYLEIFTFSPTMAVYHPSVDQIEYPYYFPYSLPMPVSTPQPIYTENGLEYQQQRPRSFLPRGSTSTVVVPNSYRQHGYQMYEYGTYKTRSSVNVTTNTYQNYPAKYSTTGIHPPRTMSMQPTCDIIIDNIRPGVDQQALKDHFCGAGYMVHCRIIRYNTDGNAGRYNERNYPGQYYATATFSSADEAEKAVRMYNGSDLAGGRVVVRLDSQWADASFLDDPTTSTTAAGDGGGESDWSRSLSFTTSSTLPLRSSVSESTVASMGTYSAYSESPKPQLSLGTARNHHHHNYRSRRDSGKELLKSSTTTTQPGDVQEHNNNDRTSNQQKKITKYVHSSSRSVSPKSRENGEGSLQQPLVVNGSMLGKLKM